jgi:hypothetical protein
MADTFTNRLRLRKIESGTRTDAWGDTFNEDVLDRLDDAISGIAAVSSTGGSSTLSAEDGATDEARCSSLQITGTLASNATIVIPNEQKLYLVRNETTGSFTLTIKTSSGTGITITQGAAVFLQCDGSNGVKKVTPEITISTGAVAGGIDIVVDTTPQLGGDLDANGHNIGFDDNTGITDDSGNEQIVFQKTASAVNQVEVTNAATTGAPKIAASGGDTNVDLELAGKGTGGLIAVFKKDTGLGIYDSDSSHALKLKASSNLTAARTLAFVTGDADRALTLGGDSSINGTAAVLAGGQTLVGGFNTTPYSAGSKSTGTFTPDPANSNFQYATNDGAHTLAPPSNACTLVLEYTNGASAGAVTTSGFTDVDGATLTTTNGHKFFLYITKHQNYSSLFVKALQ